MRVKEVNFTMRDGKQNLRESYLFTAGFLDDGSAMDHKLIRDLLDLDCISIADKQVEPESLDASFIAQLESLRGEVEDRKASFLLQQETLIDTASLGLKTKFDAKIRMYQAKKTTGTKAARKRISGLPFL